MILYKDPVDEIFDGVAAKNPGVVLVRDHYDLGPPIAVTNLNGTNTTISITSNTEASAYEGSEVVRYRRLDLSALGTMLPATLEVANPDNTAAIQNALTSRYGIPFYNGDLIQETYNLVDGTGSISLRASSGSLRWIGQVSLQIVPAKPALSSVVTVTTLPGYVYPHPDQTRPFAKMYSYWRDFSAAYAVEGNAGVLQSDALLPWYNNVNPEFSVDALESLAAAMAQITGDPWVHDVTSRYSLANADIWYIGEVANVQLAMDASYKVNDVDYSHVCVITLDATSNLGYNGELYLHFNVDNEGD